MVSPIYINKSDKIHAVKILRDINPSRSLKKRLTNSILLQTWDFNYSSSLILTNKSVSKFGFFAQHLKNISNST